MNKDYAQIIRRLRKAGTVTAVENLNGGHVKLRLCNGTSYTCARTPSDHRARLNMEADIKRLTAK